MELTFEQALALVPEHILLDKLASHKSGDEDHSGAYISFPNPTPIWEPVNPYSSRIRLGDRIRRRPIPEEVRRTIALQVQAIYKYGPYDEDIDCGGFEDWLLDGRVG